jgi:hypothetical protein
VVYGIVGFASVLKRLIKGYFTAIFIKNQEENGKNMVKTGNYFPQSRTHALNCQKWYMV